MNEREHWRTQNGFLLASTGIVACAGNIWNFPYLLESNGGSAFFVPYFFAVITIGFPVLLLQFNVGRLFRAGAPVALGRMNRRWEALGWIHCLYSAAIAVYYCVIAFHTLGPFSVLFLLLSVLFVLLRGISSLEGINRLMLPLLFALSAYLFLRGTAFSGAASETAALLAPQWGSLTSSGPWAAACGQVLYSLFAAFPVTIAFSSYLPAGTDLSKSAAITALMGFSLQSVIALGILSLADIPLGLLRLPAGLAAFAVVFCTCAVAMSGLLQSAAASLSDKFRLTRKATALLSAVPVFVAALLLSGSGPQIPMQISIFMSNAGLLASGLLTLILIVWFYDQRDFWGHAVRWSNLRVEKWCESILKLSTVFVLGVSSILLLMHAADPSAPFTLFPNSPDGWVWMCLCIAAAILIASSKSKVNYLEYSKSYLRLVPRKLTSQR